MKRLIFILIGIWFLTSCSIWRSYGTYVAENEEYNKKLGYAIIYSDLSSKSWGLVDKPEAAQIFADGLTKNDLYVRIDLSSVIYKDKKSSVGLGSEECSSSKLKHDVILRFGNYDGITSQKYTFDSSKVYFIKGNKKYYLLPNKKGVFNLSENFSKDKNTPNPLYRNRNYPLGVNIFAFSSPLICKQLDNAILVIGGIFINGVEAKPIKIRITYSNL